MVLFRRKPPGPMSPSRKNPLAPPPEARLHPTIEVEGRADVATAPRSAREPEGHLLGLRVDVVSPGGLRTRVPGLLQALDGLGARASFFVAMGPQRTGAAVVPFTRTPSLFRRALRISRLAGMALPEILPALPLPPPAHGPETAEVLRGLRDAGHEVAPMGWDFARWRARLPGGFAAESFAVLDQSRAHEQFRLLLGKAPAASASPGFVCSDETLRQLEGSGLAYSCDCRGMDPFYPVVLGRVHKVPQVPVTLPTLWELLLSGDGSIGRAVSTLREEAHRQAWPVLAIGAEADGGDLLVALRGLLEGLAGEGWKFVPLGGLLEARMATGAPLPRCTLSYGAVDGNPRPVTLQMFEV